MEGRPGGEAVVRRIQVRCGGGSFLGRRTFAHSHQPRPPPRLCSKTFLAAVVKGTNQRLALLCAAGQASDAAKALSEKLQRLVDPLGEVLLAEAAAEFSQPNQALPRARKRRRMIRTYSVGVLRELETDPGREELQVRARRSVTRTETKELVLTQKNFNKL